MTQPGWTFDHIGIAVPDLEPAISMYVNTAGLTLACEETVREHGVKVAFLATQNGELIEILAPLSEETQLSRFLQKRGPGLHHVCYKVKDIDFELSRLALAGMRLIDLQPRPGSRGTRIAFIHPSSMGGVLVEICQYL